MWTQNTHTSIWSQCEWSMVSSRKHLFTQSGLSGEVEQESLQSEGQVNFSAVSLRRKTEVNSLSSSHIDHNTPRMAERTTQGLRRWRKTKTIWHITVWSQSGWPTGPPQAGRASLDSHLVKRLLWQTCCLAQKCFLYPVWLHLSGISEQLDISSCCLSWGLKRRRNTNGLEITFTAEQ